MADERRRPTKTTVDDTVYSDFKTGFSVHPVKKDLVLDTNRDSVKRSIKNIVQTNYYERPFKPTFGGNITGFLFENLTVPTLSVIRDTLTMAINNYESRAIVHDIQLSDVLDSNHLACKIVFSTKTGGDQQDFVDVILERVR